MKRWLLDKRIVINKKDLRVFRRVRKTVASYISVRKKVLDIIGPAARASQDTYVFDSLDLP